ncbi:MAG: phosphatase PAP2 family protein [Solirubrobacteraceae bacterium]
MDQRNGNTGSTPAAGNQLRRAAHEAEQLDLAVYSAVAQTPTPSLDQVLGRLSHAADYSRLSIAAALVLSITGGSRGRAAAASGLLSVAVTATLLNLVVKPFVGRRRPERDTDELPEARQVRMPSSASFPSGHTAAAFAFATGVSRVLPQAGFPLRTVAAVVAYSRVHTGVHYPGDVLAGAALGGTLARGTTRALGYARHHHQSPAVTTS